MFRMILAVIFVALFLIISIPVMLIELIIGIFSKKARDMSSLAIVTWAFRVVSFIAGVKAEVRGEENVPKDEAVLFVANHRSVFDIVVLYGMMKHPTGFVAKKELSKVPVLGGWMKFLHCKFLDRKDIRQGMTVILSCIEDVKNGISIFIFPEGTRGKTESELEVAPFKEGSMKVAVKGGVKIIPIAISNSCMILEKNYPRLTPARIWIEYGEPIDPKLYSKEDQKRIGELAREKIIGMLENIEKEADR